jgi:hypothetical protein
VDPLGRKSGDENEDIPGCSRLPGGSETVLDDSVFAAYASELMEYQVDSLQYGRYKLYASADSHAVVTVTATFSPKHPGFIRCEPERTDRLRPGRHGWTIDVRRAPPKGECAVKIAPLVQRRGATRKRRQNETR